MARPTRAIGASAAEPGPGTAFRCSVRHFDAKPMSRSDHSHPALFSCYSGQEFAEGSGRWSVCSGGSGRASRGLCLKKIEEEVKKRMRELESPSPPAPFPGAGRGETG
jgi:hypothetical protein